MDITWTLKDNRFDTPLLHKMSDVMNILCVYDGKSDPDFPDDFAKWQIDAVNSILNNDDLLSHVEPLVIHNGTINGSPTAFYPFCEILHHAMKDEQMEDPVSFDNLESDCGVVAMVGPKGWNWVTTIDIAENPMGSIFGIMVAAVGEERAQELARKEIGDDANSARPAY